MFKRFICIAMLAATAFSCRKQEPSQEADNGRINLTVSLERGNPVTDDGSRVILTDESALAWEGNESVGIIFSKTAGVATEYRYTQELKTLPGCPGVFSGSIDPGEFSLSDIIGIVYPYNAHCWGKYSSGKHRIVMEVGTTDQIQPGSGRISGEYLSLFTPVRISDFEKRDNGYILEGKELQWGCSLLEFNVYGRNGKYQAGEKLEAVEAYATTTKCQAGTAEWITDSNSFTFNGATGHPHVLSALREPAPFGETPQEGVKLFASVLPRGETAGTTVEYTDIFVFTDKAVYKKTFSKKVLLKRGTVLPVNLDISTFERTSRTIKSSGYDSVMFFGYKPLSHKPVKVYYNIPSGFSKESMPILLVMHGNGRNARSYMNSVKTASGKKGFIAVTPEFTKNLFSSKQYHLGWVSNSTTAFDPVGKDLWTYNIIESLFDFVKEQTGNSSAKYDIWGHSAGGQFVHRFLLNMPEARVNRAVESNAGYYTVPDPNGISDETTKFGFPFSICDMAVPDSRLKKYFAHSLTVHLGTADTATTQAEDPDLPVTPGAEAQGACRFERGQFFYNRAKRVADSLGFPFNWQLENVKGVAHSASGMAQNSTNGAIVLLYGK